MDKPAKELRFASLVGAINTIRELIGYAEGQRDDFSRLDFEEKEKYKDEFFLKEKTSELKTALTELSLIKHGLEREIIKDRS